MECYLPGLTQEVRDRLFGRAEHWKAAALLNRLAAEGASVDPTAIGGTNNPPTATPEPAVPATSRRGRKLRIPVNKERLRGYREKLKMTQAWFAQECDVDPNTIQRGEAGEGWESDTYANVASGITRMLKDAGFGEDVNPEDLQQPQNPKFPSNSKYPSN